MAIFKYFATKPQGDIGDGRRQRYFTENFFVQPILRVLFGLVLAKQAQ